MNKNFDNDKNNKAYIVAVDMGYGHQRAAYPLLRDATAPAEWNLSKPSIIAVNNYPGIPFSDSFIWATIQNTYKLFSHTYTWRFIGKYIYRLLDYIEQIPPFYPRRDLSRPMIQTRLLYRTIKNGHGRHIISVLNKNPLPLFTSYFVTAFFAEEHGYKGAIYCLCTDSDISRAWAPLNPKKSRIIYCSPSYRVTERLKLYGIQPDKIVTTGFPLPLEIMGESPKFEILRTAMARRLGKLDPKGIYQKRFSSLIIKQLGKDYPISYDDKPLVVTFPIGGAGAQFKIGIEILNSLAPQIKEGKIKLNLIAGTSAKVFSIYKKAVSKAGLAKISRSFSGVGFGVEIMYNQSTEEYMRSFSKILVETDILWTKPSELSFYAAAGIPIIMAPPLGMQEEYNREWLRRNSTGYDQFDPRYANEWLPDMLDEGILAEAAMNGFMNIPKHGTTRIEDLIFKGKKI